MFKRISISLLLLANVVLVTMLVVPHHHHGERVCFVGAHCRHEAHECEGGELPLLQDALPLSQEHDHEHPAGCCQISEWLLPDIEIRYKHQHHCICTNCGCEHYLFVAILPDLPEPLLQAANLLFRQTQADDFNILLTFAGRSHGLRAPPFDGTPMSRV